MTPLSPTPEFPKTYRQSTLSRIIMPILGCITAGVGLMVVCSAANPRYRHEQVFVICFGLFGFAIGALVVRLALGLSVVLTSDTIEVTGLWSRSTLRFNEIRGRRYDGRRMNIFPRDESQTKLVIMNFSGFAFDDFFRNWLASIPNLNAIDHDRQHAARESDLIERRKKGKLRFYEKWMGLDTLPYDGAYVPLSAPRLDETNLSTDPDKRQSP